MDGISRPKDRIDLRYQVEQMVSRAIDSSTNYNGKEYEQNRHNWVQITTDRVIAAVMQSLPDPIDVSTKYEILPGQSINVKIYPDMEEGEQNDQLQYLTNFSMDNGYNRFYYEYTEYLKELYSHPQGVLQSEHEHSESRSQHEDTDQSDNQEPSKVR